MTRLTPPAHRELMDIGRQAEMIWLRRFMDVRP
jgi:hypothetical protein